MIIEGATKRDYTDILLIQEHKKKLNMMIHIHLPEGPTAYYRLSSYKVRKDIKEAAKTSIHYPELILNNFNTRLGQTLGRMFASVFPQSPEFEGRKVVTFHNQRDFIFFRHHRYIFDSVEKARLQEIGPRFTLKLIKLQHDVFDPANGEYVWIYRGREMGKKKGDLHL
mmetsp:Transcript_22224/g.33064  ORF Transcript_22224/g.33064 Transcript_22224/m.33064 type:complete len:168 (-) Transcript_22224:40-543(-)